MNEYTKIADEFCKKNNITIEFTKTNKIPKWNPAGYVYNVLIKRNEKTWNTTFTNSLYAMQKNEDPTSYDFLACIQKYEVPNNLHDFCCEFGYDEFSENNRGFMSKNEKAMLLWKSVQKEYNNVIRMFSDVMKELEEIQ